jgi:hypothetical protein
VTPHGLDQEGLTAPAEVLTPAELVAAQLTAADPTYAREIAESLARDLLERILAGRRIDRGVRELVVALRRALSDPPTVRDREPPPAQPPDLLLSIRQVADTLGCSKKYAPRLARKGADGGGIEAARVGAMWVARAADLDEWTRRRRERDVEYPSGAATTPQRRAGHRPLGGAAVLSQALGTAVTPLLCVHGDQLPWGEPITEGHPGACRRPGGHDAARAAAGTRPDPGRPVDQAGPAAAPPCGLIQLHTIDAPAESLPQGRLTAHQIKLTSVPSLDAPRCQRQHAKHGEDQQRETADQVLAPTTPLARRPARRTSLAQRLATLVDRPSAPMPDALHRSPGLSSVQVAVNLQIHCRCGQLSTCSYLPPPSVSHVDGPP